jgi:hypothetical protein
MGRKRTLNGEQAISVRTNLEHRQALEKFRVIHGLRNRSEALRAVLDRVVASINKATKTKGE